MISLRYASEALPENGLIKTSFVSSSGIPKNEQTGENAFTSKSERCDNSNSSHIINIAARHGRSDTVKLNASFIPSVKLS